MNSVSNERILTNLSILDAKNYDKWCKQMNVLFGYRDVLEVINNGVTPLIQNAIEVQHTTNKEEKNKDYKALFLIHQCGEGDNFDKVGDCDSSNQAWEILEKSYAGIDKEKVVRLQTHKTEAWIDLSGGKETINDFAMRITRLVNQVKTCGETITEQYVIVKILRSLMPRFDNIVVVIEESNDLEMISKEEL